VQGDDANQVISFQISNGSMNAPLKGLTESIACFITANSLSDIPPVALDKAKKAIADTFAVILAGAGAEVSPPLLRYVRTFGEPGSSMILGTGLTASPQTAALVNGTFGHALDFDDVLTMMPAHPSAVILSALCAEPRSEPLSGSSLLEAYMVGIEVGAKIGLGITVGHYHRGFHGTGTLALFSALAALAKLHRLDVPTTRIAFGIASSMSSGLQRNFGTMTKPLHTGWAARSALVAVQLARSGFTAALDALEGKAGFFAAYGVEKSDPAVAARHLGNPWFLVEPGLALKKYACTYAAHRGIDAVLELKRRHGFDAGAVTSLECHVAPGGLRTLIYPAPRTGLEGKFSMQYALAAGVLDGRYSLWTFTDEAVARPQIREILARIHVEEDVRCADNDPLLETRSPGSRGFVEVTVSLKNGISDTVRVDHPTGHPLRELGWDDLEGKFDDCAAVCIPGENARAAFKMIRRLEGVADMNELLALLH